MFTFKLKFITTLFFTLILSISSIAQLDDDEKYHETIALAKKIKLPKAKIAKITELYTNLNERIAYLDKKQQQLQRSTILYFYDEMPSKDKARLKFRRELAKVISKEEFAQLFGFQFEERIDFETIEKYEEVIATYPLNDIQKATLKNVLKELIKDEIITWAYYTYDPKIGYAKTTESKVKKIQKLNDLIESFGFQKKASTYNNAKTVHLISMAKKAQLNDEQIQKILVLLANRDDLIAAYPSIWAKNDVKYSMYFHDQGTSKEEAERQFKEGLAKVINKNEFGALFAEQFAERIERETTTRYDKIIPLYPSLDESKKKVIRLSINNAVKDEIYTQEYYRYDPNLNYAKTEESKTNSAKQFNELLKKLGVTKTIDTVNNSKIAHLIKQAKKAFLTEEQIKKLISLIAKRDDKIAAYPSIWAKNNAKYALNFHDKATSKEEAHRQFKEDLANLITLNQFNAMFKDQLEEQIKRDAYNHLKQAGKVYNFNKLSFEQKESLKALLLKYNTNKKMYTEYYEYDWTLRTQKLRVLQFRFEKDYKRMLTNFGVTISTTKKSGTKGFDW